MICPPCREAGEVNRLMVLPLADSTAGQAALGLAVSLHGQCQGGTWCDCHHKTGQHLNPQRMRQA